MWLRRCGFWKKFNVKLEKTQGLQWPCGELKTVRSPHGLHKKRKAAVRFGGIKVAVQPPQTRRKLYVTMALPDILHHLKEGIFSKIDKCMTEI